jgi:hypothetical protein
MACRESIAVRMNIRAAAAIWAGTMELPYVTGSEFTEVETLIPHHRRTNRQRLYATSL